jgi:hypothetical protein
MSYLHSTADVIALLRDVSRGDRLSLEVAPLRLACIVDVGEVVIGPREIPAGLPLPTDASDLTQIVIEVDIDTAATPTPTAHAADEATEDSRPLSIIARQNVHGEFDRPVLAGAGVRDDEIVLSDKRYATIEQIEVIDGAE